MKILTLLLLETRISSKSLIVGLRKTLIVLFQKGITKSVKRSKFSNIKFLNICILKSLRELPSKFLTK